MNPPNVYELTTPSSHKTSKSTKSVPSILTSHHGFAPAACDTDLTSL
jgi:hypothetical protein